MRFQLVGVERDGHAFMRFISGNERILGNAGERLKPVRGKAPSASNIAYGNGFYRQVLVDQARRMGGITGRRTAKLRARQVHRGDSGGAVDTKSHLTRPLLAHDNLEVEIESPARKKDGSKGMTPFEILLLRSCLSVIPPVSKHP